MLRYVLKGYKCPVTLENLRLANVQLPRLCELRLSGTDCHLSSRHGMNIANTLWIPLSSMLDPMARIGLLLSSETLVVPEPKDNLIPVKQNGVSLAFHSVANFMRSCRFFVHNETIVQGTTIPHVVKPVGQISKFVGWLTGQSEVASYAVQHYKGLMSGMADMALFPRASIDYDRIGFRDYYYTISDGIWRAYDMWEEATTFVFRYFDQTQQQACQEPAQYMAMLKRHLIPKHPTDVLQSTVDVYTFPFMRHCGSLLRKRARKEPVLFLVGPPDTCKSTMLFWIEELFAPSDIGMLNEGSFPFTDFMRPKRILFQDEMATSKIKRSQMLLLLEGATVVCEEKGISCTTENHVLLDFPCAFAGNYHLEYKNDDTGALAKRILYHETHNPVKERDPLAVQKMKVETASIIIWANEAFFGRYFWV